MTSLKHYIAIIKPGIILGNCFSVVGGIFLAANRHIDIEFIYILLATLFGISCVMAAGCVINNIIDRDIDVLMQRTKNRVLVQKKITISAAWIYAIILASTGELVLVLCVNCLTALLACMALVIYIGLYSLWLKRSSVYGTFVGSISGALPPVVGYCAISNTIDTAAIILMLVLIFWQMVHSYAIAIFRLSDYQSANIPVLPVIHGVKTTKISMLLYAAACVVSAVLLYLYHYTGILYFLSILLISVLWLYHMMRGFFLTTDHDRLWARKIFMYSVLFLMIFSIMMAVDVMAH